MNKNILIVILVIALAGVVSIYLWSSNNRYYMITNTNGLIVKLDKKTGNMWRMDRRGNLLRMPEYRESQNYEKSNKNTKSAATKDKAFLNSTWKMSPNEIQKATGLKLIEVNNKFLLDNDLPDIFDTSRFKRMKHSDPIELYGIDTHVTFYFFDNKLFQYNIYADDFHETSIYDIFYNNVQAKFGDALKTEAKKFTININWKSNNQNVRYIFPRTGQTDFEIANNMIVDTKNPLSSNMIEGFLDITFEYLPFIVEINKISKGEKEEYF